jgi:hypothetical protein
MSKFAVQQGSRFLAEKMGCNILINRLRGEAIMGPTAENDGETRWGTLGFSMSAVK